MRDGFVKRLVKRCVLGVSLVDLWVRRLALRLKKQPKYRLTGSCEGCGKCCEAPTLQVSRFIFASRRLKAAILWWQKTVNGFELVDSDARFKLFVFRCSHYDAISKKCDSYDSRPLMCRDYPKNLMFEAMPQLFSECSHGVVLKKAAQFRQALEKTGLSEEQRKKLEKKLLLREDQEP